MVLKPAHLSYKCTVCTATFNLYKLFETHVYTVHSGAMKRSSSAAASEERPAKRPTVAPPLVPAAPVKPAILSKSAPKPEPKEATSVPVKPEPKPVATPAPAPAPPPTPVEEAPTVREAPAADSELGSWCAACKEDVEDLASHLKEKHMRRCRVRVCHIEKCDRCLCSFDGMIVIHTSDFGEEDSSEEEEDEDDDTVATRPEAMDVDEPNCSKEDVPELESKKPEGHQEDGERPHPSA